MENQRKRIALLIDGENVAPKYAKTIMDELSSYNVLFRRLYGNYNNPATLAWHQQNLSYSITPCFQDNYTTGKSASENILDT